MASREMVIVISAKDKASKNIDKVSGKSGAMVGAFKKALPVIAAVTVAIGSLAVVFGKAFNAITDFNKGLATIATLIPNNRKRIEQMRGDIQALSVQMGSTTADLTEGMFQVVSAFGDGVEATEQLRITAGAAAAGGATTAESLALLSAVTKGYGDTSATALQKVADLAFVTNKLGQTTFPELASSMGRVVPLASTLNVSQEELFATFATLTGVTGGAAEVSTQMAAALQGLLKPTAQMATALKKMGVENVDATIKQDGLVQTLRNAIDTTDGSSKSVSELFGSVEGLNAVLALTSSQADVFDSKLAEIQMSGGAAAQAFEDMTQGVNKTGFEFQQLQARSTILWQIIGNKLDPVFRVFIKSAVIGIKSVLFGMEALEQAWNVFKIAVDGGIVVVADALRGLFVLIRLGLKPLDELAKKAVSLGLIDVNPFDSMTQGLENFQESSRDVFSQSIENAFDTAEEYIRLGNTMDGLLEKSQTIKAEGGLIPEVTPTVAPLGSRVEAVTTAAQLVAPELRKGGIDTGTEFGAIAKQAEEDQLLLDQLAIFQERELALVMEHTTDLTEIERVKAEQSMEFAKAEADFKKKQMSSTLGATSSFLNNIFTLTGSKNKALFKSMKAFAIGQALMDTYAGATKALSSVPFPFNIAAMGSVIAAGLAQVQQIRSQTISGGGGGGAISAGGASLPSRTGGGATAQGIPVRLEEEREKPTQTINLTIKTDGIIANDTLAGMSEQLIKTINDAGENNILINSQVIEGA